VEILTPLNIKDKTIGLIALGSKESGDMYNDEDLQVLEIVGAQTAIAMENALLYDETRKFNINLKREVERATKELREANEQLKILDQAKSDFISIASHQLRTPLTIVKGYVSMMLEGNFGELNPMERDSLEKVFESNERLIRLVENLLNISRIESGRMQYTYEVMPLEKVVDSVVDELQSYAIKMKLKLSYKKQKAALPLVRIDEEKIRQVVMNLIDNAIKYTKAGTVTVSLKEDDGGIIFTVSDSGMGINPLDISKLFKKFSRVAGTNLVHTEGTGLGLYVARTMIEAHKGRIWAESDGEGLGSRFSFWLPAENS
jgi:signal transduction histidine kinase